jgi:hypothetical protein
MIEHKGLGNKRVNRVNVSLNNRTNTKLSKLATACHMRPTTLAALLIEKGLDNTQLILELQKEYNIHNAYRVLPVQSDGQIEYVLNDKQMR